MPTELRRESHGSSTYFRSCICDFWKYPERLPLGKGRIRIGYFRDHQRARPIRNVATFVPDSISMSGITFDMIGLSLSNLSISRIRSPFFLLFRKGPTHGNPSFS
uniref:Uncharacterized protein n=1 Tax=Thalassia hemprichii TaxID=55496 RepID=A0A4Y1KCY8_9LILI|nr:hypothetical protein [Thalassia hemprichii]ATP74915.1 hypothetical protein [Thalassia hemprichii]